VGVIRGKASSQVFKAKEKLALRFDGRAHPRRDSRSMIATAKGLYTKDTNDKFC